MTQAHAKPNQAKNNKDSKFQPFEIVNKAEKKLLHIGLENIEKFLHPEKLNHLTTKYADICSGNINACLKSSNAAVHNLQKINNEILENGKNTFSDFTDLSLKAMSCRTFKDIFNLQQKAGENMVNKYLREANKMSALLFDSYNQYMKPLNECSTVKNIKTSKAAA